MTDLSNNPYSEALNFIWEQVNVRAAESWPMALVLFRFLEWELSQLQAAMADGTPYPAKKSAPEPVDAPAAPAAETAAPRFVVVTSAKPGTDKYEVAGAVMLAVDAPEMVALRRMFADHLADIAPPNTYFSRPSRIASDLLTWLVERGFAQYADAVECNVTASLEQHSASISTRNTWFDLLPLPRCAGKEK